MSRWNDVQDSFVGRENLFINTFPQVVKFYSDTNALESWQDKGVISIRDSDNVTGLYEKSDIIIQYDLITLLPMVIAERVFRRNYSWFTYWRYRHQCLTKLKASTYERVENCNRVWKLKLNLERGFFDIIYFDEGWYECEIERQRRAAIG